MSEAAFIVSDLHLGNGYFFRESFLSWLDQLPAGAQLILNGDIIDDPDKPMEADHQAVLDRLVEESRRRSVIWVHGNHDEGLVLEDAGEIKFVRQWEVEKRLLVVHGDELDSVMPRHGVFKALFRAMHKALIRLGFPDVHVARFAKKWGFLYRVLNNHVASQAINTARSRGYEAVACGHTHAAMDLHRDGRRYLNSGAWTEEPHHYVCVEGDQIDLRVFRNGSIPGAST